MQKHTAYNLATGEILTTDRANHLKRWLARHIADDRKWFEKYGGALSSQPMGICSR